MRRSTRSTRARARSNGSSSRRRFSTASPTTTILVLTNIFVGNEHPAVLETADKSRLDVVRELDRASVLLNPLRRRILRELRAADSASGLSRKLGMARQKLNYHLREL